MKQPKDIRRITFRCAKCFEVYYVPVIMKGTWYCEDCVKEEIEQKHSDRLGRDGK